MSGKVDSTQYTPVFHGESGWQLYFGPQYTVALQYKYDQWMHLKVVVRGDQVEIYVDSEESVLFVNDLIADLGTGAIEISTNLAPAYFANFSYEKSRAPKLQGSPIPQQELANGLIQKFSVSELIADKDAVPGEYSGAWTDQNIETMGAINISRHRTRREGFNTVLVRMIVTSERNQIKKFIYGYSR